MNLTEEQEKAIDIIIERYKHHEKYTVISGWAGTGKSTCVKYAVEAIAAECDIDPNVDVGYACFTGKACQVLIDKGNKNAVTLHKLLYKYTPLANGTFRKVKRDSLDYKIIIVDEVSMASRELIDNLFSYPVYVICLGDDFQLPPIDEESNNHLLDNPHARLTEILRQEKGNSIIELSTLIREGKDYRDYKGTDAFVIGRNSDIDFYLNKVDIALCGKNNTRVALNNQIRKLKGKKGFLDENEILINNHNDWEKISDLGNAFTNGVIGTFGGAFENFAWIPKYIGVDGNKLETISGSFKTDTGDDFGSVEIDKRFLMSGVPTLTPKQKFMLARCKNFKGKPPYELTYGYAITVHKAQGSQWNKVFIQEEWMRNDTDISHRRWLYTAVTRAINKCVILRG